VKLEGSLDAFSLPDIFQLLSFTKKNGGLHLAGDGVDGVVFFAAGLVTGASADGTRQPLARRLIGSGAIGDDALSQAVQRAGNEPGIGVVKALLEAGAVDVDLVRQAVTEQTLDAVFDLLRWTEGDFAFVVDESNPDLVDVTVSVESVLAEAEARREGWEAVSQLIPSPGAVLSLPLTLDSEPSLSSEEWSLLALVDGRRTVADLVDLTGRGQYAVVTTLAGLVQRALLGVREDGDDHVSVVVRRQALLAPLEGEPFRPQPAPVRATAPATAAATAAVAVAASAAPATAAVPAAVPAPAAESAPASAPVAQDPKDDLVTASSDGGPVMLGGAHVPGDVVPPRAEPFLPKRQAEYDEGTPAIAQPPRANQPLTAQGPPGLAGSGSHGGAGGAMAATAVALDPDSAVIERDPSVNRSLMLRLIAGVRGL
jgi:hypothetical protein